MPRLDRTAGRSKDCHVELQCTLLLQPPHVRYRVVRMIHGAAAAQGGLPVLGSAGRGA